VGARQITVARRRRLFRPGQRGLDGQRFAAAFVSRLHDRVTGRYLDAQGIDRDYSANDPILLSWVHVAFTEAFLGAYRVWGEEIPGGEDAYVRE
jgi:uncharacterized protein (DUF2236 family)